ncbi:MAG: hypothetical protein RMJ88_13130 [Thermogemmata sp.]|nr:hypothetical protein [Thermogemmata sp.]
MCGKSLEKWGWADNGDVLFRTARYDYNQILYRLDLDHPALQPARSE